jgi:hypothetical protein
MTRKTAFQLVLLTLAVLVSASVARAAPLDRGTAEADTQAAMTDGHYTFCSSPARPLSFRARRMCPIASELSSCQGFAKACDELNAPKPERSSWWTEAFAKFMGLLAMIAAGLAIVGCLIGIGIAIVRYVRSRKEDDAARDTEHKPAVTVGTTSPMLLDVTSDAEVLLREASELAARGSFDLALFTYLGAALRALDERGAIRIARHRTHGEYVRGCREAGARPALREIALDVDRVRFGGDAATADAVERAAARAIGIVRTTGSRASGGGGAARIATTLLFVLSLVLSLGACGGGGIFGPGSDPAGDDLLLDLLVREGATARHMAGSIASLPMQGAEGPVVILDTTKTSIDDETSAHLLAWVGQGGVLVLAGNPDKWPKDFWAKAAPGASREARVETPCPADDDACAPPRIDHIHLAEPAAMSWPHEGRLAASATLDSGELYAAVRTYQRGTLLGLASNDLLTNAGLSMRGNPSSLVALLESLEKTDFLVTRAENGVAPPSNPFSGLVRVGLGLGLVHALVFVALLFVSVGTRHARPIPVPPPPRRAFAEHVRATGALYARAHATGHALRAFGEYADRELRARAPRGTAPALFLAQRADADPTATAQLLARALATRDDDPPNPEHLLTLRRLSALLSKAILTNA